MIKSPGQGIDLALAAGAADEHSVASPLVIAPGKGDTGQKKENQD
jgi:hypothetical protein